MTCYMDDTDIDFLKKNYPSVMLLNGLGSTEVDPLDFTPTSNEIIYSTTSNNLRIPSYDGDTQCYHCGSIVRQNYSSAHKCPERDKNEFRCIIGDCRKVFHGTNNTFFCSNLEKFRHIKNDHHIDPTKVHNFLGDVYDLCKICGKLYLDELLEEHKETCIESSLSRLSQHGPTLLKCDVFGCEFVFKTLSELQNHQELQHTFCTCPEGCGEFLNYADFFHHLTKAHPAASVKRFEVPQDRNCTIDNCNMVFLDLFRKIIHQTYKHNRKNLEPAPGYSVRVLPDNYQAVGEELAQVEEPTFHFVDVQLGENERFLEINMTEEDGKTICYNCRATIAKTCLPKHLEECLIPNRQSCEVEEVEMRRQNSVKADLKIVKVKLHRLSQNTIEMYTKQFLNVSLDDVLEESMKSTRKKRGPPIRQTKQLESPKIDKPTTSPARNDRERKLPRNNKAKPNKLRRNEVATSTLNSRPSRETKVDDTSLARRLNEMSEKRRVEESPFLGASKQLRSSKRPKIEADETPKLRRSSRFSPKLIKIKQEPFTPDEELPMLRGRRKRMLENQDSLPIFKESSNEGSRPVSSKKVTKTSLGSVGTTLQKPETHKKKRGRAKVLKNSNAIDLKELYCEVNVQKNTVEPKDCEKNPDNSVQVKQEMIDDYEESDKWPTKQTKKLSGPGPVKKRGRPKKVTKKGRRSEEVMIDILKNILEVKEEPKENLEPEYGDTLDCLDRILAEKSLEQSRERRRKR